MTSKVSTASDPSSLCCVCQDSVPAHFSDQASESPLQAVIGNRALKGATQLNSAKLLDIICDPQTSIDVALCHPCVSSMSDDLGKQMDMFEKDVESLSDAHAILNEQDFAGEETDEQLKAELAAELETVLKAEAELEEVLRVKQEQERKLIEEDSELYRVLRHNHRALSESASERKGVITSTKNATETVEKLTKTNIFDSTFLIWTAGDYGLINGLRVGRLPNENVDWNEINAAFGQLASLLMLMCRNVGLVLQNYEILPFGSHSVIKYTRPDGKSDEYQLYGTGSWHNFGSSSFDNGIAAYVNCVAQLEERLRKQLSNADVILPYRIEKDKIVDGDSKYLVRLQFNSEERWTRAMKCLLIDLKRLIGVLSNDPANSVSSR